MSDEPFQLTGAVVAPPRTRLLFFAGLFAAYACACIAPATRVFGSGAGWIALGLAGAAALAIDFRSLFAWKPVFQTARFSVDADCGTVEGDEIPTLDRDATTGIEVREVDERLLVKIEGQTAGGTTLAFRSRKKVARLLDAISSAHAVPVIVAPSRIAAFSSTATVLGPVALIALAMVAVAASFALYVPYLVPLETIALAVLGAVRAVLAIAETHIRVHDDGIEWQWLGRRRLLPYERIEIVRAAPTRRDESRNAIEIVTTDGHRTVLAMHGKQEQRLLLARLRSSVRPMSRVHDALAHKLRRAGRTTEDWVAFLRSVGGGADAAPRVAAVQLDALERLARDPKAHARDRAAATVALATTSDPTSIDRVRFAVESSTVPALKRVVLASASKSDDDGALIEALAELDDEPEHADAQESRAMRASND